MLKELKYVVRFLKLYLFVGFVFLEEGFVGLFCLILGSFKLEIVFIKLL